MRKRDKVLLYAPHFAEYSTRLAQAMAAYADILLFIDREDRRSLCDDAWFEASTANLRVVEFSVSSRLLRMFWTPVLVVAALLFRPNVFHVQEQADFTSCWLTKLVGLRAPVVVTVHDPKPHSGRDSDFIRLRGRWYRDQIRTTASLFHVHGAFCLRQMLEMDTKRPVIQTYHCLLHVPAPDQIDEPEPNRVLFFGRMEAYKGLEVLLDAADALNQRGRDYRFVIAGSGEALDRLSERAVATPGVVLFNCFLPPAEVVRQFQKCAVAVLPYLDATQSGVAAGAIANGRPIVSSAAGGLLDVIVEGRNGLLVPPGDATALADALDRVLQDAQLRDTLTSGARATQALLDWDVAAETLVESYRNLPQAAWSRG